MVYKDKEKQREKWREWYYRNKDYFQKWRDENKDKRKEYNKKYASKNKNKLNKISSKYRFKHREKINEYNRNKRKNEEERIKTQVWAKVYRAIQNGNLKIVKICSECDSKENIIFHHENYSKPLEVKPLCKSCHSDLHLLKIKWQ